jgi:membrane-associated phospholipid phosphatase
MTDKRLSIGAREYVATDRVILVALAFSTLLTILFYHRVEGWWILVLKNIGAATLYIILNSLRKHRTHRHWVFFLRMASILFIYSYLNQAVDKLQLIIYGRWLDDIVLAMEKSLFGVQPTLWMQRLISKPLTEWMMFAYVAYLPLYPIICGVIFKKKGAPAAEDYFFTLGLSNVICNLGFILFPVAGPFHRLGAEYAVPLDGFVWTWIGEALRHYAQFVGGSIPSPHCANATVMWLMAYRYHRPTFWILSPIVLSLYVSTVYGRYHYVTDSILGIAVGFLAVAIAPALMKLWEKPFKRGEEQG